jgi:hypothetical protein
MVGPSCLEPVQSMCDGQYVDGTGMGQTGFATQYQRNVIGYQLSKPALILNNNRDLRMVAL